MREIGSEFHFEKTNIGEGILTPSDVVDSCFVFSGRTAIETVLKNEPDIHKALLPSYCCDSMIEPFRQAGINVSFYSVSYENGLQVNLIIPEDVDCILWCNYFGFSVSMPDMSEFLARGGIVIEDITHSFYSKVQSHEQSTFLVASLRKWEPLLCGGYCASRKGAMNHVPVHGPMESFVTLKMSAMNLKRRYLDGDTEVEKSVFLGMFSEANDWLADNYTGLSINQYSKNYLLHVDYRAHQSKRISNAIILYEGLTHNPYIEFLFPIEDMDCPLFVPVIVQNGKRDLIRKKLIEHSIYCPVHWPHPKDECKSNLYDIELSLICDHRYNEKDMQRIVEVLNNEI